ncbi:MAG: NAD(P)-binding domain-containing protein [Gammaproteobacteria bacterium AqS3]|nr:NAD(P)-binding domain-containing protein [Gammaproteobacteria bacterium AqS3]
MNAPASRESSALRICVIGGGNMGGAIVQRWLECTPQHEYRIIGRATRPDWLTKGATWFPHTNPGPALDGADLVMLAVKPAQAAEVAEQTRNSLPPEALLVSVLAGVRLGRLAELFGRGERVYRCMPNTPFRLGCGISVLCGPALSPPDQKQAQARSAIQTLYALGGAVLWADEGQMDFLTAALGSSPAFAYRFAGALALCIEARGFDAEQARTLAAAVVNGAGAMLMQTEAPADVLIRQVASPNGATQRGLELLSDGGYDELITQAVAAAEQRSAELGRE